MPAPAPRRSSTRLAAVLLSLTLNASGCTESGQAGPAERDGADGAAGIATTGIGEVVIAASRQGYVVAPVASPGTVTGTVTLARPLTALPAHPTGSDSTICGASMPDGSIEQRGSGVGGVVVWLDGVRSGKALPLERRLALESDDCRLSPRVQAAVVNSAVNVIGHQNFRQHLQFIAGGERAPRVTVLLGRDEQVIPTERPFRAPGLVIVRDTDHVWPRAYLAVFDHPYFAVTGPDGSFAMDGVPPGKYTLVAWHERTKRSTQTVEVTAGGTARVALALEGK